MLCRASLHASRCFELDEQHRRLQLVQAEVAADQSVEVFRLAAVHAQDPMRSREPARCSDAHAGVAERAEILCREERQTTDVADAARAPPVRERGADRLSRVFDDREPMLARNCD